MEDISVLMDAKKERVQEEKELHPATKAN